MEREELKKILGKHSKWRGNEKGGEKANLSFADLHSADLHSANLSFADLHSANLSFANLHSADLSSANLSSADLSSADLRSADLRFADLRETIYEDINWLAYIDIVPNGDGKARAYKLINSKGQGVFRGGIDYLKADTFSVDKVDSNINNQCSYGINLATFGWCIHNRQSKEDSLLIMEFDVKDAVCPMGSDGKFRVKKCHKIGKADWKGNLIKVVLRDNKGRFCKEVLCQKP